LRGNWYNNAKDFLRRPFPRKAEARAWAERKRRIEYKERRPGHFDKLQGGVRAWFLWKRFKRRLPNKGKIKRSESGKSLTKLPGKGYLNVRRENGGEGSQKLSLQTKTRRRPTETCYNNNVESLNLPFDLGGLALQGTPLVGKIGEGSCK